MAYIGKTPVVGNFVKLDAITTSATTTFNLTSGGTAYYPQTANNCIVSLNGVIQSPTTDYTISGSTIVFASALTTSDVINFITVFGDVLSIGTPSDGTITSAKLASGTTGLIAWQSVQTTGFTAVAGRGYPCNTTSAAFTVTLPASPSVGDTIILLDYAGTFATNNITLGANSNKIEGGTSNKLLTTNREAVTLTYVDSTQGWVSSSGANEGTQSLDPNAYSIDFLVVAGGAGTAGNRQGGGGGGGFRTSTQTVNVGSVITVTVGAGGAGKTTADGSATSAQNGSDSSISGSGLTTITSTGGGGGGTSAANSGGSGGGGSNLGGGQFLGGSGNTPSTSPSQGNKGGDGASSYFGGGSGAGGGGAGAAGTNSPGGGGGSNGGNGSASSITGSSVTYAGGGGGGGNSSGGTGGTGGGGNGAGGQPSTQVAGVSGTVNTGGGGGGGTDYSGTFVTQSSGGSGVVILSMLTTKYTGTTTGSPTVTTNGSYKVLTFTGSGSYTA